MTILSWFDIGLAALILIMATAILAQRNVLSAVAEFMCFGLLMSLAWVRVDAPDLALAEAAIGSGVTGALLLGALHRTHQLPGHQDTERGPSALLRYSVTLGCTLLAVLISLALLQAWPNPTGLTAEAHAALPQSGVSNPVTAVILNYRAYDTMLEIGVLLAAALGAAALSASPKPPLPGTHCGVAALYIPYLRPVIVLFSIYVVWAGAHAPGGAFQAGAMLAGLGVALLLGTNPFRITFSQPRLRAWLGLGFAVFLGAGMLLWTRDGFLTYPPKQAKHWILVIELACTASIAVTLTYLFNVVMTRDPDIERPSS